MNEDLPDGDWMDKWGSCRVCGGEIPHGHSNNCDVYRYERQTKALRDALEHLMTFPLVGSLRDTQAAHERAKAALNLK